MNIQEGTLFSLPEIICLWKMWAAEKGFTNPDTESFFSANWEGVTNSTIFMAVARVDGRLVGWADGVVAYDPASRERILNGRHLYVVEDWRGCGVAQSLMLKLWVIAHQAGATKLVTHGEHTKKMVQKMFGKQMEPLLTLSQVTP